MAEHCFRKARVLGSSPNRGFNKFFKQNKLKTNMRKRGISTVVVTVLMILIAIVAVIILWQAIKSLISQDIGINLVSLKIKSAVANGKIVDIKIKREIGEGNLVKIKFVFENERSYSEIIENNMGELEERDFSFNLTGKINATKVSVAPIVKTEKGNEKLGNLVDSKEIENSSQIQLLAGIIKINPDKLIADISLNDDGTPELKRIQIKWDISSIPANKQIDNGKLCMYIIEIINSSDTGFPDNDANVSRVINQSWDESISSCVPPCENLFNSTNMPLANEASATWSSITEGTWSCVDVTTQLRASYLAGEKNFSLRIEDIDNIPMMINTVEDNDGLIIGAGGIGGTPPTNNGIIFEDRENSGSSGNLPYLNITYT